jgi:Tannase and feruloyl esterase
MLYPRFFSEFRESGGKIMFLNGLSDPIFSARETIEYFERLVAANGGLKKANEFATLFLVPGMNHCASGPATDRFDLLTPLIDWVENGDAPERIIASGASFPGITRPLCPYPTFARYTGQGSVADASSFACAKR